MTAPIKNSCPDIDKGIILAKNIKFNLEPIINDICSYSINDIEDMINNSLRMSLDIETCFEEVRSVNSDLRTYTEEQEERVTALEKELKMVRTEMEDLKQELEEIRGDYHV